MKTRLRRLLFVASFGAMATTATAENVMPRDNPTDENGIDAVANSGQAEVNKNEPVASVGGPSIALTSYAPSHPAHIGVYGYRQRHVNCDRQLESCLKGDDPD